MATTQESQQLQQIATILTNLGAKLSAVGNSVDAIKTSIVNKNVDIPAGTKLSQYASKIDSISTGDPADYSPLMENLSSLSDTLDAINGEIITAAPADSES